MAGPTITRANLVSYCRLLTLDTSTTSPGISDANWLLLLREALFSFASLNEEDEILSTSASASLTAGNNSVAVSFSNTPLNVLAVYLSGTTKLKKVTLQDMLAHQAENPNATGEPTSYAIHAAGSRDSWTVYVDNKADQTYTLTLWYMKEPAVWAADGDTTPFGDHAALCIARMASVEGARILGRPPAFIDQIGASLSERLRGPARVAFRSGTRGGTTSARPA